MKKTFFYDTAFTIFMLLAATAVSFCFFQFGNKNVANTAVIYTLALILTALRTSGYVYGIAAALFCMFAVNYFFSYPYFKFNFSLDGYPVTFIGMLAISVITSATTTALKRQRQAIADREKALAEADREKLRANLLRAISHDLRTPLTAISGNAGMLMEKSVSLNENRKQEMYRSIYDDSMWLVNLTENLLSITRIENGTLPLRRDAELIGDIFHEALSHVDRRAAEHEIRVELEDDMLMANMDARLIVQVIINIVNNAVKYTPEGSDICLSAKKENSMVRIEIADNGPGISDEAKQRLFDMFYTVNTGSAGADSRRGLGLGLSLCKSIVEAHSGSITVHDNQPHGSVFSFTLPLEEVKIQNV